MTDHQLTFLNYQYPESGQDATKGDVSKNQWGNLPSGISHIITSQAPPAGLLAKTIQQQIRAEVINSDLWQHNQTPNPPGQNENILSRQNHAGVALQSLFSHPPGKYLVITHEDIFIHIIASILGGTPYGLEPYPSIHLQNGTLVSIKYNHKHHQWNFLQISQPESSRTPPSHQSHNFTLIRHGESIGNVQRVFQGQKDYPLSEEGKNQAAQLAKHLKKENVDYQAIISSPLTRTMQTAETLSHELGLSIQTNHLWIEIDNGNLAGLSGKDRKKGRTKKEDDDRLHPFKPVGEVGESWWQLYLRGGKALQKLLERPPGNYLVVSHGGILNAALWNILGTPPQPGSLTPTFHFSNTASASLLFDHHQQRWELVSFSERVKI